MRWAVVLLVVGCTNLDPDCPAPYDRPARAQDLRVISYNIGNSLKQDGYALRVRDAAYEAFLGERIRAREADIVLLQEVLPPNQCETFTETNPARTCSPALEPAAAAKRILGPDYSVACDANHHVECIGVRVDFGTIEGVAPGGFALTGAETTELPGPPCDFIKGECEGNGENCDVESSVSTVLVQTATGPLRVIHGHPSAIGPTCLQKQLQQTFDFLDEHPAIVGGDWNFDPSRLRDVVATAIWSNQVGEGRRLRSHAPHGHACRLGRTSVGQDASLDRVLSDFALGTCTTWAKPRLDDGYDFTTLDGGRADHYAVECDLYREAP